MFSDHLRPIAHTTSRQIWLGVAGLTLVCLLVAVALVAGGQVQKAELRQMSEASFHSAFAGCLRNSHDSELSDCVRLVSSVQDSKLLNEQGAHRLPAAQGMTLATFSSRY